MEDDVFDAIASEQRRSNNKCGMTIMQISELIDMTIEETKPILKTLHTQNKIVVRKGLNNALIFLPSKTKNAKQ